MSQEARSEEGRLFLQGSCLLGEVCPSFLPKIANERSGTFPTTFPVCNSTQHQTHEKPSQLPQIRNVEFSLVLFWLTFLFFSSFFFSLFNFYNNSSFLLLSTLNPHRVPCILRKPIVHKLLYRLPCLDHFIDL